MSIALQGQILLQSNATAEASSKTPDTVADVSANSKVRLTSGDTDTYEGFVKFDISTINAERLSVATVSTSAGQHNPSGVDRIDPYWVDMYGSNTVDWPEPFTWKSSRSLDKSKNVLASENIQGQRAGCVFRGTEVAEWIKLKKNEGAKEVTFRFHAREEHPFGVWVNGTYKNGMQLLIEYKEVEDDPASYTDTLAKINFTFDNTYNESGWINIYGSNSFTVNLGKGASLSISGNDLNPGIDKGSTTIFPPNVGSTYNFIEDDKNNPLDLTISGLAPDGKYKFEFLSGINSSTANGDKTTTFDIKNSTYSEGEFLIFDETFTYDESLNGFKWFNFYDIENAASNWKMPFDYENGEIFERYQVIGQPTNQKAAISFGIWQDIGTRESVSDQTFVNGPGSVGIRNSSPSTWWELDENNTLNFSRPSDFLYLGFPLWSDEYKLVSPWSSNSDWDKRNLYHPMTVRASVVAVPKDGTFSGWSYWLNRHKEVSVNPIGNTDSMLVISGITPAKEGEISINMSKHIGNYGYINALIITCHKITSTKEYNIEGHKIAQILNEKNREIKVNMTLLKSGIYLIKVANTKGLIKKSFKIIKR